MLNPDKTYVVDFAGGFRGQRVVRAVSQLEAKVKAHRLNGGTVASVRRLDPAGGNDWMPDLDGGASRIVQAASVGVEGWHIALVQHVVTWERGADRIVWKVVRMGPSASAVLHRADLESAARVKANVEWLRDVQAQRPFGVTAA